MTLDEVIKDMETIAEKNQRVVDTKDVTINMLFYDDKEPEEILEEYQKEAENYRQLAEWLKELKQLREQEPCDDAISRQEVLDYISRILNQGTGKKKSFEFIQKYVEKLPPVNPQPKTGHWIHRKMANECWEECSECHVERAYPTLYCPDCGAKMIEPQEVRNRYGRHRVSN